MRSERFQPLLTAQPPFVSLYFDDSHDTADAAEQLAARWRDLYKHMENAGVEAAVISRLEGAVLHHRPSVGRRGRGIIATRERVLLNEQLTSPPQNTTLRISDYPYILPLLEFSVGHPTYVVAAVDHLGADVIVRQGDTVRTHTVDGGGYPVHKSAAAENEYSHPQQRTEEAIRKNVRAVVEDLTHLVEKTNPEVVFVSGEVRARSDVVSALPERVSRRVHELHAGVRSRDIDNYAISRLVDAEFERRRSAEIAKTMDRFQTESGRRSGFAVTGLAAVCAALGAGNVDTLIIGEFGDATVVTDDGRKVVATSADALSEMGKAAHFVVRADEALPFAAIAVDASLVRIDSRIAPADGIAALLRYAD